MIQTLNVISKQLYYFRESDRTKITNPDEITERSNLPRIKIGEFLYIKYLI